MDNIIMEYHCVTEPSVLGEVAPGAYKISCNDSENAWITIYFNRHNPEHYRDHKIPQGNSITVHLCSDELLTTNDNIKLELLKDSSVEEY